MPSRIYGFRARGKLYSDPGFEPWRTARSGAVFAYAGGTTDATEVIAPTDSRTGERFGATLARSGPTLIVGSPSYSDGGRVSLFEHDGLRWANRGTLTYPGSDATAEFGGALAADADRMVIGAPREMPAPDFLGARGAVYVHERLSSGWSAPIRVLPTETNGLTHFGSTVDLDGDTLVATSRNFRSDPFSYHYIDSEVYVFVREAGAWREQARLERPPSPAFNLRFAHTVALRGDTLFVAAPEVSEVHVFQRSAGTWQWAQRIPAPEGDNGRFGSTLQTHGTDLWVGSPDDVTSPDTTGSTHRYRETGGTWRRVQSIESSPTRPLNGLGSSVAIRDHVAFIGAPLTSGRVPGTLSAGAVAIEELTMHIDSFED